MALSSSSNQLQINVRADSSQLRADLALAEAKIRDVSKELRNAATEANRTGDSSRLKGLADSLEGARGRAGALRNEIAAINKGEGGAGPLGGIAGAFSNFRTSLGPVRAAVGDLRGSVREFGASMSASAATILPFNTNILAMAAGLTAALAPLALLNQAKKAALATDDIVDTAENLKITTAQLVALRQVSEASGASFDILEKAMQKGNRTLGEAAAKTKGFQTTLQDGVTALRGNAAALNQSASAVEILRGGQQALVDVTNEYAVIAQLAGTTVQDLAKMNPIDRLLAEGRAIGKVKDETEQARLANAAWGKTYSEMLPILRDSTTLLLPAIARVKEFKQGVSEVEKEMSERFLQAFARMNTAVGRLSTTIGGTLGTAMVPIFEEIERVIVANRREIEAFATSISKEVMPVVQDFVTLVRGGGRAGLKTDFVKGLATAFLQVRDGATIAFNVIKAGFLAVAAVLAPVAAAINAAFGTEFTGKSVAVGAALLYLVGGFGVLTAAVKVLSAALLLAFANPVVALIAGIAIAIATIDTEALRSGKTLETLKGTWQGLRDIAAGLSGVIGRWFTTNIVEPAEAALAAVNRLVDRMIYLATLGLAGRSGGNDAATARIPPQAAGAEQFDAHVQSLKDATAANTETLKTAVTEQTASLKTSVSTDVSIIRGGTQEMGDRLSETIEQGVNVIRGLGTTEAVNAHIRAFTKALEEENTLIRQSVALITGLLVAKNDALRFGTAEVFNGQGVGGGGSNILPMATGGSVRGPGGRDRVPAWLTAGEFVHNLSAVRHYGLDFMHRINTLQIPRFELGGLIDGFVDHFSPSTQSFAAGGMVAASSGGGRSSFTLQIGDKFFDAHSDGKTVEALGRAARWREISSGGTKPSSYR